jgi:hypothetical protein
VLSEGGYAFTYASTYATTVDHVEKEKGNGRIKGKNKTQGNDSKQQGSTQEMVNKKKKRRIEPRN